MGQHTEQPLDVLAVNPESLLAAVKQLGLRAPVFLDDYRVSVQEADVMRLAEREAAMAELIKAMEFVLPRLAHKAACHSVRPAAEWAEHGSASFANCDCEIKVARAAIAAVQGAGK